MRNYPSNNFGEPAFISHKDTLPLSPDMSYSDLISKIKEHSGHQSLREITKTLENITSLGIQFENLQQFQK